MKKRVLTVLIIGLVTATTACAISPQQRARYERSGCTQSSIFDGCDLDKSYEWNERHGFIKGSNDRNDGRHSQHNSHNNKNHNNGHHDNAGIDSEFYGNYEARFNNGQHVADIQVEDSGVYVNGTEVRDTNAYKGNLAFRVGYATYTIQSRNHWGHWEDKDAGNSGTIVPRR